MLPKEASWSVRSWPLVLAALAGLPLTIAGLAHSLAIAPPSALAGVSSAVVGPGFFAAWHQPYGLPGVHALKVGAGYGWEMARLHAHLERENWDDLWESRSATLGGALRTLNGAGLSLGGEWKPRLEILSAGPGSQAPRLLFWDLSRFDLGAEWRLRAAKVVDWAIGSAYAPGQTQVWLQTESRPGSAGSSANAVWSARFTLQIPVGGLSPSDPPEPLAALHLAYAWLPGFSLVGSAEAAWSSRKAYGTAFSREWQWSAALTLPWGQWRGQSLMQSQSGLPATLGAALGWGGWSGSEF